MGIEIHTRVDLLELKREFWPNVTFYDKQVEIIDSVERNAETFVPAGNQLGKDFVTGFICAARFLRCRIEHKTCRILTTSATDDHLDVLWAEINHFVATAKVPLTAQRGGPLVVTHHKIRLAEEPDQEDITNLKSYVKGQVTKTDSRGEGLQGHHAEDTLAVGDEASGLPDITHSMFQGWAKRKLYISNCNECSNFFRKAVALGDLAA